MTSVGKTLLLSIIFSEPLDKKSKLFEFEMVGGSIAFDATFLGTTKRLLFVRHEFY